MNAGALSNDQAAAQPKQRTDAGRQQAFSKILLSLPGDDTESSAGSSKKSAKKDEKEENSQAVTAPVQQTAQPKVLLPLTLLPASGTQEQGNSNESEAGVNAVTASAAAPEEMHLNLTPAREVAFAVKLLEANPAGGAHIPIPAASSPNTRPESSLNSKFEAPPSNSAGVVTPKTATSGAGVNAGTPVSLPARAAHANTSLQDASAKQAPQPNDKRPAPRTQASRTPAPEPQSQEPEAKEQPEAIQHPAHWNTSSISETATPEPAPATPQPQAPEPAAPARIIEPAHLDTAAAGTAAKDISLQIAAPDRTSASIRIVETGSELRVAVRASDSQLAETLRGGVDQLTSRLNGNGWSTEVWHPTAISPSSAVQSSESQMQQRHGSGEQSSTPNPNRDRNNNNQQKRPEWVEEFDLCK